jgi:hypothetical protein
MISYWLEILKIVFFKSPNMRWLRLPAPESVQVLALALLVGIVFYQVLTAHSALASPLTPRSLSPVKLPTTSR